MNITECNEAIATAEAELSAIGVEVEQQPKTYNIGKANARLAELQALLDGQAFGGASTLPSNEPQQSPVAAASAPAVSFPRAPQMPAVDPPPVRGAKLHKVAALFPAVDASGLDDHELYTRIEAEAHKAGLKIPGQRSAVELSPIYGSAPKLNTEHAIALATIRQSAIDSVLGVFPTSQKPQAAQVLASSPLGSKVLSALYDSILCEGAAASILTEPIYHRTGPGTLAARANEVRHSVYQSKAVHDEMVREISTRAQKENAEPAKVHKLMTALYHLGVRHSQLDFTNIEPDEDKVERNPRKIQSANRKTAAFFDALSGGTSVCSADDVAAVAKARELVIQRTGAKRYTVGMSYFQPTTGNNYGWPKSNIPA